MFDFVLKDVRHGPLPALLLVLTVVTGLVDAVSYLNLGRVFVANMTGNIVFLGFAVSDVKDFSIPASLIAVASFLTGALAGGRLGMRIGNHRGRLLATTTFIMILLVGMGIVIEGMLKPNGEPFRYFLIVLLALAMGLQNATARRLAVPDLTTTVLTLTLTGLAADSTLAGGSNPRPVRRWAATASMFFGAGVGAFLVFHFGILPVLGLVLVLLVFTGIAAYRFSSSSALWTTPV